MFKTNAPLDFRAHTISAHAEHFTPLTRYRHGTLSTSPRASIILLNHSSHKQTAHPLLPTPSSFTSDALIEHTHAHHQPHRCAQVQTPYTHTHATLSYESRPRKYEQSRAQTTRLQITLHCIAIGRARPCVCVCTMCERVCAGMCVCLATAAVSAVYKRRRTVASAAGDRRRCRHWWLL